ncbi:MAG: hypothetical protein EBR34_13260 [Sphingomonadaceae bacterium]|nr:hypothetical protein [Sphingomonadaceae bacterium]
MTIHIAAACSPLAALVSPARRNRIVGRAANDNGEPGHSAELRAALKHFAEHGLGAATVARQNAEQAFFRGDRPGYLHWLGICRTLDRRMATVLNRRVEAGND